MLKVIFNPIYMKYVFLIYSFLVLPFLLLEAGNPTSMLAIGAFMFIIGSHMVMSVTLMFNE